MKYQMAPMEGITTYIFRNAYAKYYGGIEEYFSPFISLHKDKKFNEKEKRDINPENNKSIVLTPQVITNNSDEFIRAELELRDMGYKKVNLNFGCPSSTVTEKNRGAGILKDIKELDRFLDEIFSKTNLKISIKTRLGFYIADEWEELINVYSKYPLEQLIVHARVREDYYKNSPDHLHFKDTYNKLNAEKISYNGNIFNLNDEKNICEEIPNLKTIMLGRGLIANPNLLFENDSNRDEKKIFKEFTGEVFNGYIETLKNEKDVLYRMKELWFYFIQNFEECPKIEKQIKRAKSLEEYKVAVNTIFRETSIKKDKNNIKF